jgi:hydrogenase maturation protease
MIEIWSIGKKFRSDDSLAFKASEELQAVLPDNIPITNYHGDPMNLLHEWNTNARVYIIDAIQTGAFPVGHVHFQNFENISLGEESITSTHGLGVSGLLKMAKALELIPKELFICGVEANQFSQGLKRSKEVEKSIHVLVKKIIEHINHETGVSYA